MNIESLRRIKSALNQALTQAIADDVCTDVYQEILAAERAAWKEYEDALTNY